MFTTVNGVRLRHFNANEFRDHQTGIQYDRVMDRRLLVMLDVLRHMHGYPIMVSNGRGAIGRDTGTSYHNHHRHGSVQAIDIIPSYISSRGTAHGFVALCERVGFAGIGIYPEWLQGVGIHVDVGSRPALATWGQLRGKYVALDTALETLPL